MKVTVLVPCWNEAEGLENLFSRLRPLMMGTLVSCLTDGPSQS